MRAQGDIFLFVHMLTPLVILNNYKHWIWRHLARPATTNCHAWQVKQKAVIVEPKLRLLPEKNKQLLDWTMWLKISVLVKCLLLARYYFSWQAIGQKRAIIIQQILHKWAYIIIYLESVWQLEIWNAFSCKFNTAAFYIPHSSRHSHHLKLTYQSLYRAKVLL